MQYLSDLYSIHVKTWELSPNKSANRIGCTPNRIGWNPLTNYAGVVVPPTKYRGSTTTPASAFCDGRACAYRPILPAVCSPLESPP